MNKFMFTILVLLSVLFGDNSRAGLLSIDIPNALPVEGTSYDMVNVFGVPTGESYLDFTNIPYVSTLRTYNSTLTKIDNVNIDLVLSYDDSAVSLERSYVARYHVSNQSRLDCSGSFIGLISVVNQGVLNFSSGTTLYLELFDSSITNIYGGEVIELDMGDESEVNIYGYDFDYVNSKLIGFWQNNDPFEILMHPDAYDKVSLITIPEPASLALLALGGLIINRKRL